MSLSSSIRPLLEHCSITVTRAAVPPQWIQWGAVKWNQGAYTTQLLIKRGAMLPWLSVWVMAWIVQGFCELFICKIFDGKITTIKPLPVI